MRGVRVPRAETRTHGFRVERDPRHPTDEPQRRSLSGAPPGGIGSQKWDMTNEAFWPPKPKLLEIAVRNGISRAVLGT
jgi:hypothetical protein